MSVGLALRNLNISRQGELAPILLDHLDFLKHTANKARFPAKDSVNF